MLVDAAAPVRICDLGGWTDTWFAGYGQVLNIAVGPCVRVRVSVGPGSDAARPVTLDVVDFGDRYSFDPAAGRPGRHPLVEAAVEEIGVAPGTAVDVRIQSEVPPGCSTGTSAAVAVALVAALDALTPGRLSRHEVARAAHRVETQRLGWQSGIQDQIASSFGGINFIDMRRYPDAEVAPVDVDAATSAALGRGLVTVFLGRAHRSSDVHREVIAELEREGSASYRLDRLREIAVAGRDALRAGDLDRFAEAMRANTDAQAALHPGLVGAAASLAIAAAAERGALGWKVNGAGGDGGSVTVLCGPADGDRERVMDALVSADPSFEILDFSLDFEGVRVEVEPAG